MLVSLYRSLVGIPRYDATARIGRGLAHRAGTTDTSQSDGFRRCGGRNRDTTEDDHMTDHDNGTSAGESATKRDRDAPRITACEIDGDTVMFDVSSDERWLKSDTTVDLEANA